MLLVHPAASVRYWCQDETRLGLKTIQRRKITAKGVKPLGQVQWQREAFGGAKPYERLWQHLKSKLAWNLYETLDQLRQVLAQQLQQLHTQTIASLTGWDYILNALSVAGIP